MAAAATELTGGALTITGVAFPAGPLAVDGRWGRRRPQPGRAA